MVTFKHSQKQIIFIHYFLKTVLFSVLEMDVYFFIPFRFSMVFYIYPGQKEYLTSFDIFM